MMMSWYSVSQKRCASMSACIPMVAALGKSVLLRRWAWGSAVSHYLCFPPLSFSQRLQPSARRSARVTTASFTATLHAEPLWTGLDQILRAEFCRICSVSHSVRCTLYQGSDSEETRFLIKFEELNEGTV
jgi:hypothetical protein